MGVMINFSSWEWPFLITLKPMWLFNQFVITTFLTWCCEHENKIKHEYLVDKKPRLHRDSLATSASDLRWNRPCYDRILDRVASSFARQWSHNFCDCFWQSKHSQNLPGQWRVSESVRDHFWDKGDLTETLFDTDCEWPRSLRPNPKILSQRGRNPGVNGV